MFKLITRTVWLLSLISLFNDVGSEMLIPVIPLYLRDIGYSTILIGSLEGFAEALAGIGKIYFGGLSDAVGRRNPFVISGYTLSAIAKPLMGLTTNFATIFTARMGDRLGKGIRTAARDAMLSDETTAANKGRIFGFHKSMDTVGAVIGPLMALIFLIKFPGQYRSLFLWAIIPGVVTIAISFLVKEKKVAVENRNPKPTLKQIFFYGSHANADYKRVLLPLVLFGLFNSADVFLLLRIKEMGFTDQKVLLIYIFYNLVFAAFASPLGILGDKIGLKKVFAAGLFCFAFTYFGIIYAHSFLLLLILFFAYGLYAAATDGIAKAMITNTVKKNETALAVGFYSGIYSLMMLLASVFAGFLWKIKGSEYVFMFSAAGAILIAVWIFSRKQKMETTFANHQ